MKILIPVLGFDRTGGYRVLSKLADELIFLGHQVSFLSPDKSELPYFPTKAEILWIEEKGTVTTERKESGIKENAFSIQKKLTRALKSDLKNTFDIIIANHSLTTLPVKRAGLESKTIYYVQAYEPEFFNKSNLKDKVLRYLSERGYQANFFIVVNAEPYLKYKKLNSTRILHPGIDFNLFYPKEKTCSLEKNKIIIGTIGRIEAHKGTRFVIDAFLNLKKKHSNIELHIAFGNEQDFKGYKDIYCFQPHGDKALGEFYRSLDYYICAGYVQLGAFHYPIAEAMSCGIPVITTPYYPANESNAWIIKTCENSEAIVTQFERAISNPLLKEKKVKKGLMNVKQFDWKKIGEQLNQYIEELANKIATT